MSLSRSKREEIYCPSCGAANHVIRFSMMDFSVADCQTCGLSFKTSAAEEPEFVKELYNSEQYWQKNPNRNDGGKNYNPNHSKIELYQQELARLAKLQPNKGKLLDVGSAKGVFLDVARKNGWTPFGVELSAWASNYAREQFKINCFTGTLESYPKENGPFDAITMLDVIEHVANPVTLVASANKLLKEGGVLLVGTPNSASFFHKWSEMLFHASRGAINWPLQQIYGFGPGGHVLFYNRQTLNDLLRNLGFEVLYFDFYAVDQGLWRPTTLPEKIAGVIDNILGGMTNSKYHMTAYARKIADVRFPQNEVL